MKNVLKILFSLIFFIAVSFSSNALCINCGCQNAYNDCIDNNGDGACEDCGEDYCKDNRRACHGSGIKSKIFK